MHYDTEQYVQIDQKDVHLPLISLQKEVVWVQETIDLRLEQE